MKDVEAEGTIALKKKKEKQKQTPENSSKRLFPIICREKAFREEYG